MYSSILICLSLYVSIFLVQYICGVPQCLSGEESACVQETLVQSLGQEDPLGEVMATHSSILAWRILWTLLHCIKINF